MDEIQKLIDKYGPQVWNNIAAPIWEMAVRQVYANAITGVVWTIALLAFVGVVAPRLVALWAWNSAENAKQTGREKEYPSLYGRGDASSGYQAICVFGSVACLVAVVVAMVELTESIQQLVNPNWYALQNLVRAVK